MSEQPTQITSGQTAETTEDNLTPLGATPGAPVEFEEVGDPLFDIAKLASFLDEAFPGERDRTNLQQPESVVDTAIRMLQALSASAPLSVLARCGEEYCNRPAGHVGECGVVHNG